MHFLISGTIIFLSLMLGQSALASPTLLSCDQFKNEFSTVRFIVSERNGYGDVAAAYLNILKLINECKPQRVEIAFKNEVGKSKFQHLLAGQNLPLHFDLTAAPDLIILPASERGYFNDDERVLSDQSVVIKAPVFSDSESMGFYGSAAYKRVEIPMGVPGLGPNQIGIYPDSAAASLRGRSKAEIFSKLSGSLTGRPQFERMAQLLNENNRVGLLYGVSLPSRVVVKQIIDYISGLEIDPNKPTILFTPSDFLGQTKAIHWHADGPIIKDKINSVHLKDLPENWQPDPLKINVVQVPNLPIDAFVSLMAYSAADGIVPLGAGDGFISSAIAMGIPFALVQVMHNTRVITDFNEGFKAWLKQSDLENERKMALAAMVDALFPISKTTTVDPMLEHAQLLLDFKEEFENFSESVPIVLQEWIKAALFIKKNHGRLQTSHANGPEECLRFL